ncbi:aldo/keto reductase family domain-containing protein [Ditylenchus destructor]|uniref:Aldo/keto reductase family domain-containing protein n=1 Tax=Ditylenchus destructor TaxID=166010 RepID=A0AAD4QVX9_9BILA|nr:aldo/keto reductase family domain-containing protein [Ditylenchus destructor]
MRRIGVTDIETPPMVFGGNVFGWTADRETSFALLDRFADAGGTLVDTADVYSAWVAGHQGGESETLIGEWMQARGKRIGIATKVGMLPGARAARSWPRPASPPPATRRSSGSESRRSTSITRIRTTRMFRRKRFWLHSRRLIDAGKVRHIAASNFSAARLKSALDIAARDGLPHYRALQPEYNLVSRHRFEGELQDLCVTHNIGVLPYYGLASGFLTGKYRGEADLGKSVRGARLTAFLEGKGRPSWRRWTRSPWRPVPRSRRSRSPGLPRSPASQRRSPARPAWRSSTS